MLRRLHRLFGYHVRAADGWIGKVSDLYFEDHTWHVRHLVADTGSWLTGRRVLIPAHRVGLPNDDEQSIEVGLTRRQIKACPSVEADPPVYRQREYSNYHLAYWRPMWGFPALVIGEVPPVPIRFGASLAEGDPHLRSVREVASYGLLAADGHAGYVRDFLARTDEWTILHVLVSLIWPHRRSVLVATQWVSDIDWDRRLVQVDLPADDVRSCTPFSLGPMRL